MLNGTIETLMNHRSVRNFKDLSVSDEVLRIILEAGTRAPSGGNLQNYSFIVIDDNETKCKLEVMDGYNRISAAPVVIIVLIDYYRLQRWFNIYKSEEFSINKTSNLFISYWDAIIALHNVTIAAESLGLGGYYIGNVHWYEDIKDLLDLPQFTFPAGMYCLGYPEGLSTKAERLPPNSVIHRNKYRIYTDNDIYSAYIREDNIWKESSQSRKEQLAKEKIFSAADFYARKKFTKDFVLKRSRGINKNIKELGFDIESE